MTGGPDKRAADANDTTVSEHYRQASKETVPSHLDEKILHHAAEEAERNRWTDRKDFWFRPLGLAAAVALSLLVLLQVSSPPQNAVVEDFSSAATEAADRIRNLGESTSASRPEGDPTGVGVPVQRAGQRFCTERESESVASWRECIERLRDSGLMAEAEAERERLLVAHPGARE